MRVILACTIHMEITKDIEYNEQWDIIIAKTKCGTVTVEFTEQIKNMFEKADDIIELKKKLLDLPAKK